MDNEHASIYVRFGDEILARGFTVIPNLLLEFYAEAGMTEGELVCTLVIWQFWRDKEWPYPSIALIAKRMKKTTRQVQRYIDALNEKELLDVELRFTGHHGIQSSNAYDFTRMIARVKVLARAAGLLDTDRIAQARDRRLRPRGDKSVRARAKNVAQGATKVSPNKDTIDKYTNTNITPLPPASGRGTRKPRFSEDPSKYYRGVGAVCPECRNRPHLPHCPRYEQ